MLEDVKKISLKNNMVVLLRKDDSSALVAINLRIKSGFLNESDNLIGISHLLEHMLFKSTKKLSTSQIKEQFRSLGGVFNGGTAYEYTIYYCTVPQSKLRPALKLEADLVYNPLFDPAELEKEKKVVIQEIKRKDDFPSVFAWEKMMELSFVKHPFGRWRIGTEDNISQMKKEDVAGFHSENYSVENSILTVIGNFDVHQAALWIKKYFETKDLSSAGKIDFPTEPQQKRLKYKEISGDLAISHLKIGFHAPGKFEKDNFPLIILSYLLGQGETSRLNQILKDKKELVSSVSSDLYNLKDLGVFFFESELDNKNALFCLIEIFKQIEQIKQGKFSESELVRAKNLWQMDFLSQFEDLTEQADVLSSFQQQGNYGLIQEFMRNIKNVNRKDIQKATRKYLNLDKATVLKYARNKDKLSPHILQKKIAQASKTTDFEFKPIELPTFKKLKLTQKGSKPVVAQFLDNGIYLIGREKHNLPLVCVDFYFKGGRSEEKPGSYGITQLTLQSTLKKKVKDAILANQLEFLGGSLSAIVEPDFFGYSLEMPSENLDGGLNLLFEILQNPLFTKEEIEKQKKFLFSQIEKAQDDLRNYSIQLLKEIAFPNHPYGQDQWGNKNDLKKMTVGQVENWHKTHYIEPNLTISAVGDFNAKWLAEKIDCGLKNLGKFKIKSQPVSPISKNKSKSKTNLCLRNKRQTAIACGFTVARFAENELYPLKLIQGILSGMGGRLFKELREKRGLAYTVNALSDSYKHKGIFYSYIGTSPDKEKMVIDLLKQEFDKIKKRKVEKDELEKSKTYLDGAYSASLQTNSSLASQYAKNHILGREPFEVENFVRKIKKVTPSEIQETALRYFNCKDFHLAIVRGRK